MSVAAQGAVDYFGDIGRDLDLDKGGGRGFGGGAGQRLFLSGDGIWHLADVVPRGVGTMGVDGGDQQ